MFIVPTAISVEGVAPGPSPGAMTPAEVGNTSPFALLLGLLQGGPPQMDSASVVDDDAAPDGDVDAGPDVAANARSAAAGPFALITTLTVPPGLPATTPARGEGAGEASSSSMGDQGSGPPAMALAKTLDGLDVNSQPVPSRDAPEVSTPDTAAKAPLPNGSRSESALLAAMASRTLIRPTGGGALAVPESMMSSLLPEPQNAGEDPGDAQSGVDPVVLKLKGASGIAKTSILAGTSKSEIGAASHVLDSSSAVAASPVRAEGGLVPTRISAAIHASVENALPRPEKSAAIHSTFASAALESGPTTVHSAVIPTIQALDVRVDGAPPTDAPDSDPSPKATLEKLPLQVIRGVRYLVEGGEHTLRIRLVPESLGEVRLEVTTSRDEISVRMASASPGVREVLQQHLSSLRDALAQDGVHVAKVSVSVDLNQSHAPSDGGRHGSAQTFTPRGQPTPLNHPTPKQQLTVPPWRNASHGGALNVYV